MKEEDALDLGQQNETGEGQSDLRSRAAAKPLNTALTNLKCSFCGNSFFKEESKFVPFCSQRCQQIDLGHWLTESYGLPVESGDSELPPDFGSEDEDL